MRGASPGGGDKGPGPEEGRGGMFRNEREVPGWNQKKAGVTGGGGEASGQMSAGPAG